ncbi:actin-like protein 8, partial [Nannospalax galili]|uniref:actin-like protein 8 n=1 Tax=Nannospalax galili TaxID=1026970 RepID=UPI0004ED3AE4
TYRSFSLPQIMFELLDAPSVLLANQMEMSLYSSGLLSGLVLDSGYGLTRVQPFYLGCPPPFSGKMLEFSGKDLSTYLFSSLFKEACDHHNLFQMDTVAAVQMGKCFMPPSLEETLDFCHSLPRGSKENNTYQLPDGITVELSPRQMMAPEMFFNPHVFDMPGPSISQIILDSVETCEASSHSLLMSHVLACGGNTLYPGFATHLFKELRSGYHGLTQISVWVSENRRFSVWLGASMVSQLSTYQSQWMTKEEYLETIRL